MVIWVYLLYVFMFFFVCCDNKCGNIMIKYLDVVFWIEIYIFCKFRVFIKKFKMG